MRRPRIGDDEFTQPIGPCPPIGPATLFDGSHVGVATYLPLTTIALFACPKLGQREAWLAAPCLLKLIEFELLEGVIELLLTIVWVVHIRHMAKRTPWA